MDLNPFNDLTGAEAANKQAAAAKAALAAQQAIYNQTTGHLSQLATDASTQLREGAQQAAGAMQQGTADALGSYGQAGTALTDGGLSALYGGVNQARADIAGSGNRLADLYGGGLGAGFETDPGYQFRQQQGEQAINRAAAAQGGRLDPSTLQDLMGFNQNLASQEYQHYANRQIGLAGAADQAQASRQSQLANLAYGGGQGAAGIYGNLSNLYGNQGNLQASQGNSLANLYFGAGQAQAGNNMGYGNQLAGLAGNMMGAETGPVATAGGGSAANAQFGQNLLGLGVGIGTRALFA